MTERLTPSGDNTLLKEALPQRKISRLERMLGPENYRIIKGLLKTTRLHHWFSADRLIHSHCHICPSHRAPGDRRSL